MKETYPISDLDVKYQAIFPKIQHGRDEYPLGASHKTFLSIT